MRGLLVTLAIAVSAGCAHDPTALKAQGDIGLDMDSRQATAAAVACVARKAAETHPLLSAQTHGADVYVYWKGVLWAIASIEARDPGSHVTVRVQPAMIVATRDSVYDALRGC